jgi:RND family efflux transporter MFP subunit
VAALAGCHQRDVPTSAPLAVQLKQICAEPVLSATRFSATIREERRIELSFKVPGTVKSLLRVPGLDGRVRDLHEGDVVTSDADRPLAQLDDADYVRQATAAEEKLAQAVAMEKSASAMQVDALATFERTKGLFERNSVARQSYDDALAKKDASDAQLEAARRQVQTAKVALRQAEDDLKHCKLVLPIPEAVVSRKNIEEGERVPAGQPILQVMDLSRLRAAFGVSDTKIGQFKIGQAVDVVADAFPSKRFAGHLTKIGPAADLRTRTFEMEVTITEPNGLRPGMVVSILVGQEENVVLVPMTAVHRGDQVGEGYVYTVVEEAGCQVARRRRIILGGVYDNRLRIVEGDRSQVRLGDPIVVGGSFRLAEGLVVRVVDVPDADRQARKEDKTRP